ncbi:MAG: cell division protein FtsZ [Archaeoglobaceae archaeon]|nr:cell division protein FtsZ [Archaeoglobaceae archaeon]MDW8014310.1 cell division protein FtsZ [Archaeoglobaceae archaeon]
MKSIISKALMYCSDSKEELKEDLKDFVPKIVVVGCGGSGNNTVTRLTEVGVDNVVKIAINTDKRHLEMTKADVRVLIGKSITGGLGAGGYPEIGRKAAEMARTKLEELLANADMVFICVGLGGGTGTGSAPVVADIAKKIGAITIAFANMPFKVERARIEKAKQGLIELKDVCDTVIVLDNNKLLEYYPNLPINAAFSVMDQLIAETIKGISDAINKPSLVNIDFADVKAVIGQGGVSVMLVGESKGQDKSKAVVRDCLKHPLLDIDYRGATGALLHITGGQDLTIKEAQEIANNITFEISPNANVKMGVRIDPEFENAVRVLAIMTGIKHKEFVGSFEDLEVPKLEVPKVEAQKKVENKKKQSNNIMGIIDVIK